MKEKSMNYIEKLRLQKVKKALSKTFYYPLIKNICKMLGVKLTKTTFANGVSKVIPYVGGVVSGVLTFASMKPMADRLLTVLIESNFDYDDIKLNKDIEIIDVIDETDVLKNENDKSFLTRGKEKISTLFKKKALREKF